MTPEEINRTIAEDRGWRAIDSDSKGQPLWWRSPDGGEHVSTPNYLDEKNPAHELIEVLRNEGWRWTCTAYEDNYVCEFYRPMGTVSHRVTTPTSFCRAVCEAYLKVRGKWTD